MKRFAPAVVFWLWPAGSTIEGCFIAGTEQDRRLFSEAASAWELHANVHFDFGSAPAFRTCPQTAPYPPLRVEFGSGTVSNAKVGTTALDLPSSKPNVFIAATGSQQRPKPAEQVFATDLHELGHVLGLRHEHQHPESACFHMVSWRELCARVPAYKASSPTALPAKIMTNFLPMIGRANADYAPAAPYDPQSIMHYKFSESTFTGPSGTCAGDRPLGLSDGDRRTIARLYPKDRREQTEMITAQAPIFARYLLETPGLDQPAVLRIGREVERLVRRGFPGELADFRVELGDGLQRLPAGGADYGTDALRSFAAGRVEAAAVACSKAGASTATASPAVKSAP